MTEDTNRVTAALRHIADAIDAGVLNRPASIDLHPETSFGQDAAARVTTFAEDIDTLDRLLQFLPDHVAVADPRHDTYTATVYAWSGTTVVMCFVHQRVATPLLAAEHHGAASTHSYIACDMCGRDGGNRIDGADPDGNPRRACVPCLLAEVDQARHGVAEAVPA